jgi:hypothetical protein
MSHSPHSKQFEIVRPSSLKDIVQYSLDGKSCHVCKMPTEIGLDPSRRYCSNRYCSALIVGDVG